MRNGLSVKNLNFLDELNFYEFERDGVFEFSLYGLGGNFLIGKKLFDKPIAGQCGKVRSKKDYWFKQMWNINLPDAKDGYAVLIFDDGQFSV